MVFVCLFVSVFCKWCDLCLVCMNLNINYSTSNKPKSQQLQSTWHSHKRPSADSSLLSLVGKQGYSHIGW